MTIDWWTIGIQTVNVVILVWLLKRFFWGPVAAMIELRRTTTQNSLAEAATTKSKAETALAEVDKTRAGFAREREAILTASHSEAEQARVALLKQAGQEAAKLGVAAKAEIDKHRQEADKAWAERSNLLAVNIAKRLAARLDGPAVRAAFLEWAVKAIRAMPESARQDVITKKSTVEAISATSFDPVEEKHTSQLIGEAFGAAVPISYSTDPSLIAGLELHAEHLAVDNSWRADLDRILADIAHEK